MTARSSRRLRLRGSCVQRGRKRPQPAVRFRGAASTARTSAARTGRSRRPKYTDSRWRTPHRTSRAIRRPSSGTPARSRRPSPSASSGGTRIPPPCRRPAPAPPRPACAITGVRQAIASRIGRPNPSVRLAKSHASARRRAPRFASCAGGGEVGARRQRHLRRRVGGGRTRRASASAPLAARQPERRERDVAPLERHVRVHHPDRRHRLLPARRGV